MKKLLKKLPSPVQYILLVYLAGMLVFSLFRLLLLSLHLNEVKEIPVPVIFQSLFMGLRFDTVISGYFLALPAVVFFLLTMFKPGMEVPAKFVSIFLVTVYSIAFLVHVTDIRWYGHGAARFTVSALQWTDTPVWMLKFVFQDIYNYPLLVLFVALIFFFQLIIKKIRKFAFNNPPAFTRPGNVTVFFILFLLMFAGIRGRLAIKSPIRWGTAFFSPYNFANQLGLNPVYTFIRSWLDQQESKEARYAFMSDKTAEEVVRQNLAIVKDHPESSPVARKIESGGNPHRYNVVLVLMESMSAKNMRHFGNAGNLTPVLDSLFDHSISFRNFYSDGNHTFNGIYSSLYGFHSLPMVHHMKDLVHQQPYSGLPGVLKSQGYQTTFITTHDEQFDNMAGFLLPNGFDKIISEKDYSGNDVLSTLGVPDHVMFEHAVGEMDKLSKNNSPFFVAMISGSNHEPFVLPDISTFHADAPGMKEKMVQYADWSVGKFLRDASSHPWFDSTIFVFTGDHGGLIDGYDRYLAFHHLPLIIFAPEIYPQPQQMDVVGGQADIFTTVCGLLDISYHNNSMGIDLLRSRRKFYPFNFDEELCCVTAGHLLAIGHDRVQYFSIDDGGKNISEEAMTPLADSMKTFLEAAIQTTQRMIEERKMK